MSAATIIPDRTSGLRLSALVLLLAGVWQLSSAGWIHLKAQLAQHLISSAWEESLSQGTPVKPWSWADTWPVARLRWQDEVDLLVLAGINGASLPFGPALEPLPGAQSVVIAGHRDTHFTFLGAVRINDRLQLTDMQGVTRVYRVTGKEIVDSRTGKLTPGTTGPELVLVTCFPLDAIRAGGPLRLVIRSELEEGRGMPALQPVALQQRAGPALHAAHAQDRSRHRPRHVL